MRRGEEVDGDGRTQGRNTGMTDIVHDAPDQNNPNGSCSFKPSDVSTSSKQALCEKT